VSDIKVDSERDENGLRSLFGDGVIVLPVDKYVEGEKLFVTLVQIGVGIFDSVFATTEEIFRKGHERFLGTKMSFVVAPCISYSGFGEFKAEVEIEDRFYGSKYIAFLIFRLYRMDGGDFSSGDWIEIKKLESSEYKTYWEKFLKLKKALLTELSK
jgi:hypothetical protein